MPLLLLSGDVKDRDNYCKSLLVFEYWDFIGALGSDNYMVRAYLYRRESGSSKDHQAPQKINGGYGDVLV